MLVLFLSPFIFILALNHLFPAFMANALSSRGNEAGDTRASTGIDEGSRTEREMRPVDI